MTEAISTFSNVTEWYPSKSARVPSRATGPCRVYVSGLVTFGIKTAQLLRSKRIYPDGRVDYLVNHKLSRTDGPARINADGSKSYWVNNEQLTPVNFFLKYNVL